jgi:ferredoxin-like protein FixX
MRSTIEMASGATVTKTGHFVFTLTELKTFEALARADERERIADESKHIIKRAEARGAAVEREACAKVCEDLPAPDVYSDTDKSMWDVTCVDCAEAIRARGETK